LFDTGRAAALPLQITIVVRLFYAAITVKLTPTSLFKWPIGGSGRLSP
jgi:hypothetical protein